jgi:hypothetical protein
MAFMRIRKNWHKATRLSNIDSTVDLFAREILLFSFFVKKLPPFRGEANIFGQLGQVAELSRSKPHF